MKKKINDCLKQISNTFSNCTLINIYDFNQPHQKFLDSVCLKINIAIDYPAYESCFLKRILPSTNILKKNNKKEPKALSNKGTIPFYFKPILKTDNETDLKSPITTPKSDTDFFRSQN